MVRWFGKALDLTIAYLHGEARAVTKWAVTFFAIATIIVVMEPGGWSVVGQVVSTVALAGRAEWRTVVVLLLLLLAAFTWVSTPIRLAVRRVRRGNLGIAVAFTCVLVATIGAALSVFLTTPNDKATSQATQTVQSAALVAGLLGGAIGIWLNDRRRLHDRELLNLDRERAIEDRFTKAVELLGSADAAVRVGAMHALHNLARSATIKEQNVIDVLCAYLRQPFAHPTWTEMRDDQKAGLRDVADPKRRGSSSTRKFRETGDRERVVRETALRLIVDLLPFRKPTLAREWDSAGALNVDLTAAHIGGIDLSNKVLRASLRNCHFHGRTNLDDAHFADVTLVGAVFHGAVSMRRTIFNCDASFVGAAFLREALLVETKFCGQVSMRNAKFSRGVSMKEAHFAADTSFVHTQFLGPTTFIAAVFLGPTSFFGSEFGGDVWFSRMEIGAAVRIDSAKFGGGAYFDRIRLGSELALVGSEFLGDAEFSLVAIPGTEAGTGILKLNTTAFRGRLVLSGENLVKLGKDVRVDPALELSTPANWTVLPGAGGSHQLHIEQA